MHASTPIAPQIGKRWGDDDASSFNTGIGTIVSPDESFQTQIRSGVDIATLQASLDTPSSSPSSASSAYRPIASNDLKTIRIHGLSSPGELQFPDTEVCSVETFARVEVSGSAARLITSLEVVRMKQDRGDSSLGRFDVKEGRRAVAVFVVGGRVRSSFEVRFIPPGLGPHEAFLRIGTPEGEIVVRLFGVGIPSRFGAAAVDFGIIEPGTPSSLQLKLSNPYDRVLLLEDAESSRTNLQLSLSHFNGEHSKLKLLPKENNTVVWLASNAPSAAVFAGRVRIVLKDEETKIALIIPVFAVFSMSSVYVVSGPVLDFGVLTQVGQRRSRNVFVKNGGNSALRIVEVATMLNTSTFFVEYDSTVMVEPNAVVNCAKVTASSLSLGDATEALRITFSDGSHTTLTLRFRSVYGHLRYGASALSIANDKEKIISKVVISSTFTQSLEVQKVSINSPYIVAKNSETNRILSRSGEVDLEVTVYPPTERYTAVKTIRVVTNLTTFYIPFTVHTGGVEVAGANDLLLRDLTQRNQNENHDRRVFIVNRGTVEKSEQTFSCNILNPTLHSIPLENAVISRYAATIENGAVRLHKKLDSEDLHFTNISAVPAAGSQRLEISLPSGLDTDHPTEAVVVKFTTVSVVFVYTFLTGQMMYRTEEIWESLGDLPTTPYRMDLKSQTFHFFLKHTFQSTVRLETVQSSSSQISIAVSDLNSFNSGDKEIELRFSLVLEVKNDEESFGKHNTAYAASPTAFEVEFQDASVTLQLSIAGLETPLIKKIHLEFAPAPPLFTPSGSPLYPTAGTVRYSVPIFNPLSDSVEFELVEFQGQKKDGWSLPEGVLRLGGLERGEIGPVVFEPRGLRGVNSFSFALRHTYGVQNVTVTARIERAELSVSGLEVFRGNATHIYEHLTLRKERGDTTLHTTPMSIPNQELSALLAKSYWQHSITALDFLWYLIGTLGVPVSPTFNTPLPEVSSSRTITLRNSGEVPLSISSVGFAFSGSLFMCTYGDLVVKSGVHPCGAGEARLAPGESYNVQLTYTPSLVVQKTIGFLVVCVMDEGVVQDQVAEVVDAMLGRSGVECAHDARPVVVEVEASIAEGMFSVVSVIAEGSTGFWRSMVTFVLLSSGVALFAEAILDCVTELQTPDRRSVKAEEEEEIQLTASTPDPQIAAENMRKEKKDKVYYMMLNMRHVRALYFNVTIFFFFCRSVLLKVK